MRNSVRLTWLAAVVALALAPSLGAAQFKSNYDAQRQADQQRQAEQQRQAQQRQYEQQRQAEQQRRAEQQRQADQQRQAEQRRAEQQRADQQRQADQRRQEQQRADQQRADQQRQADQRRYDQQRADQQRADQRRYDQQRADQQRADQRRYDQQQRADQQRADQRRYDQQQRERADQQRRQDQIRAENRQREEQRRQTAQATNFGYNNNRTRQTTYTPTPQPYTTYSRSGQSSVFSNKAAERLERMQSYRAQQTGAAAPASVKLAGHHVIPFAHRTHPLLQYANFNTEKVRNNFIALPKAQTSSTSRPLHIGSHKNYNEAVEARLNKSWATLQNDVRKEAASKGWSNARYNQELRSRAQEEVKRVVADLRYDIRTELRRDTRSGNVPVGQASAGGQRLRRVGGKRSRLGRERDRNAGA